MIFIIRDIIFFEKQKKLLLKGSGSVVFLLIRNIFDYTPAILRTHRKNTVSGLPLKIGNRIWRIPP